MRFIDMSVPDFSGQFTQRAKKFDLQVKIVLKVPKVNLTTVRLIGEQLDIVNFLMIGCPGLQERFAVMHIKAIKNFKDADVLIPLKNRLLAENRSTANEHGED